MKTTLHNRTLKKETILLEWGGWWWWRQRWETGEGGGKGAAEQREPFHGAHKLRKYSKEKKGTATVRRLLVSSSISFCSKNTFQVLVYKSLKAHCSFERFELTQSLCVAVTPGWSLPVWGDKARFRDTVKPSQHLEARGGWRSPVMRISSSKNLLP